MSQTVAQPYATGRDPEDMDWAVTHQAASAISS